MLELARSVESAHSVESRWHKIRSCAFQCHFIIILILLSFQGSQPLSVLSLMLQSMGRKP